MFRELPSAQAIEASSDSLPCAPHASAEVGHWVRTAGILAPLVIGELVKDNERKWRFIRITSVAMALISEGLYAHRIERERRMRAVAKYR